MVRKYTWLRRYWYTSQVYTDTINKHYGLPSVDHPIVLKGELNYSITHSERYGKFVNVGNALMNKTGVFRQSKKMCDLSRTNDMLLSVEERSHRLKHYFYWIGNECESPPDLDKWYESIDVKSF